MGSGPSRRMVAEFTAAASRLSVSAMTRSCIRHCQHILRVRGSYFLKERIKMESKSSSPSLSTALAQRARCQRWSCRIAWASKSSIEILVRIGSPIESQAPFRPARPHQPPPDQARMIINQENNRSAEPRVNCHRSAIFSKLWCNNRRNKMYP